MKSWSRYRFLSRNFPVFPLQRASLWLGDDHLLYTRHGAAEDRYRRFYFSDLHRISVYRTPRAFLQTGLLALCSVSALLGAVFSGDIGWRVFWAAVGGLITWWLVRSAVGGHSCACWVKTAVGETRLQAPARMRQAERMLNRIQPLIERAQASRDAATEAGTTDGDGRPETGSPPPLHAASETTAGDAGAGLEPLSMRRDTVE